MNNIYTKKFLEDLKWIVNDNLKDMEDWSAHNKDKYLKKIQEMRKLLKKI